MNASITKSPKETILFAEKYVKSLILSGPAKSNATIVGLHGDLGSGKTTFVKGVAEALGIKETVTSPTFVIEKIYKLKNKKFEHLIHIDAYRLNASSELTHLGWKEISNNPQNLIFVEWPEKVANIIPGHAKKINFTFIDEYTRRIEVIKQS